MLSHAQPDLAKVVELALEYSPHDFAVTESLRSPEKQRDLVAAGSSQTLASRHLANQSGFSEPIDIALHAKGQVTWDLKYYREVAQSFFRAAIELGVQIEWGGLWPTFIDGTHFQLRTIDR